MSAKITFFPVGNGDMTLVRFADQEGTSLLIDMNIRQAADDPNDITRDVGKDLRDRLPKDQHGRPYVDALLLSHPDKDHCTGLMKHFHLGPVADYPDDKKKDAEKKIIARELWSSPIVFRRASKEHTLCDDAKAFNTEAKRRVKVNRDRKFSGVEAGDRILILGEDEDGKTDDLGPILVKVDQVFSKINGKASALFEARLLAPLPKADEAEEDVLSKNHSSTVLAFRLAASLSRTDACRFLTGGDAEVAIWERIWARNKGNKDRLSYDLMLAAHHCSWHTLSYDSWSEKKEDAEVSPDARSALSQARDSARIVSSSKPILDDYDDPPCIRAKREYLEILGGVGGRFLCTDEYPNTRRPEPLEFEVGDMGLTEVRRNTSAAASIVSVPAPRAG
jgi:hypothetical protein